MPRLHITAIADELVAEVRYLNASRTGKPSVERLPVQRATADAPLGTDLDAIVACSDLQGIVRGHDDRAELLGIAVAETLEELAFDGVLPPAARTGVLLAGDLYSVPNAAKRGGFGDVADVWSAFAARFAWVAGVAGNHDDVERVAGLADNIHLLDGDVVELDGLRVAGVGGIISEKQRPWRRSEDVYLRLLDGAIDKNPDVLVLHEGPHGDAAQDGHPSIRATVEAGGVGLTVCGHTHWGWPLAAHAAGQIVNVDARVLVITGSGRGTCGGP